MNFYRIKSVLVSLFSVCRGGIPPLFVFGQGGQLNGRNTLKIKIVSSSSILSSIVYCFRRSVNGNYRDLHTGQEPFKGCLTSGVEFDGNHKRAKQCDGVNYPGLFLTSLFKGRPQPPDNVNFR